MKTHYLSYIWGNNSKNLVSLLWTNEEILIKNMDNIFTVLENIHVSCKSIIFPRK